MSKKKNPGVQVNRPAPTNNSKAKDPVPPINPPLSAKVEPAPIHHQETCHCKPDHTPAWKMFLEFAVFAVGCYVAYIYSGQLEEMRNATKAANSAASTARDALVIGNRPWIKVTPEISSPLTFDALRNGGPMAMMSIRNHLENVGQSTALNIVLWEDIIPVDADHSFRSALARQSQWCDAHRHNQPNWSGSVRFPHDPWIEEQGVGYPMNKIKEIIRAEPNDPGSQGKIAFVLVGCVAYRSSFEPEPVPTHQTRFMYWLAVPSGDGGIYPYMTPSGTANQLRLVEMPSNFSADYQ